MAAQKPRMRSILLNDYIINGSVGKGLKNKAKGGARNNLKRRNGLLNAAIPARSALMQIAKRNSVDSLLLQLPAEIRNKIWEYAMGHHQIDIMHHGYGREIRSSHAVRPLHSSGAMRRSFVRPTFELQKVCRQIYVETSAMIYTLNTFGFSTYQAFDRWIKKRSPGQKRLVSSIDMPYEYMRLYRNGTRKLFRKKFPNIERVGVDLSVAYFTQRMENETLFKAKQRIVDMIKENEGDHIEVAWHAGATWSLTN